MRLVFVAVIMALAGCEPVTHFTTLVPKPADGYPALRFVEPVRIANLEFKPGSVLIGDRAFGNELVYCGHMEAAGQPFVCAIREGSKLVIVHGSAGRPERDMPPGAIEEFRFL